MSHLRYRPRMLLPTSVSKQSKHREAVLAVTCTYHHFIAESITPCLLCFRNGAERSIGHLQHMSGIFAIECGFKGLRFVVVTAQLIVGIFEIDLAMVKNRW